MPPTVGHIGSPKMNRQARVAMLCRAHGFLLLVYSLGGSCTCIVSLEVALGLHKPFLWPFVHLDPPPLFVRPIERLDVQWLCIFYRLRPHRGKGIHIV